MSWRSLLAVPCVHCDERTLIALCAQMRTYNFSELCAHCVLDTHASSKDTAGTADTADTLFGVWPRLVKQIMAWHLRITRTITT